MVRVRNAEPPLVSRGRRKHVVEHLKNMKLRNSVGTTTTAFVMHKSETDPVKLGKLIWRMHNEPESVSEDEKKSLYIIGGNHSHEANLLALLVQKRNENFMGMISRVFAHIKWWNEKTQSIIKEGFDQIQCVSVIVIFHLCSPPRLRSVQ
jgi:hypothetical protein